MKFIAIAFFCLFALVSCESELTIEDNGKYNFLYSVDDAGAHKRQESSNADGTVSGSYSYIDANGDLRKVEYKAGGAIGFQPTGDISIDKKTAEKAEEIAALAPKAPIEEPAPALKAPVSPFTVPFYTVPGIHHAPVIAPLPYAFPRPLYPYGHYGHYQWY